MGHRLLFVLVLMACVFGCGESSNTTQDQSAQQANDEGMVFRRGNGGDPGSLDPHRSTESFSAEILRDLYEGLVGETVDADLTPAGAVSWSLSEDGLVYTFELRPEARWSNGDPVTAQDYLNGLRRAVDPKTASVYAQLLSSVENADAIIAGDKPVTDLGVQALNEYRLQITLTTPTPYFLGLLTISATYPIHTPSLQAHGEQFTRPGNLVGNGPYVLSESVAQSHLKLVRNPNYWDNDTIAIDTVYYYNTEDQTSELNRYRAGELDYTRSIPSTQYDWVKENLGGELNVSPYLSMYYYLFDLSQPPFKDNPKLRKAMSMAIDREVLVEQVTGVGQVPAYGLVPPGVLGHTVHEYEWAKLPKAERLAQAKQLLAESGVDTTEPIQVDLLYNTGENHKQLAVAVAAMWKQNLGIDVSLANQEFKVFLQTRRQPEVWDMLRFAWVGDYNDPTTFLDIFKSDHAQNINAYNSSEFDQKLKLASIEQDATRRSQLLGEAEKIFLDDYAIVPVYYYVSKHLVKPHVKGFKPNIMDRNQTRYYSIDKNQ